ncbi:MAG: CPBP family intramembrane metalloprotease [Candidatus Eremiobacteraeota bacterium]|nr:CPBP family intramembrane metalloprotease [Candidatus Eremiobacteraeota bacterium]
MNPEIMPPEEKRYIFSALLLAEATVLVIAIIWGLIRHIHWWNNIRLTSLTLAGLFMGPVLCGVGILVYNFLKRFSFTYARYMIEELLRPLFTGLPIFFALGLAIISGICEESFFRGILQQETGIWFSNIIFGLLHTGSRKLWLGGLWAGLVGVLLGYIYAVTGDLGLVILIHAGNNFIAIIYLGKPGPADKKGNQASTKNSVLL